MTKEQKDALGDNIEINQIDKTINSAYEIKDEIDKADIIAVVSPINLQKQFLDIAGDKSVITALSDRVLIPQPDGMESKVEFQFNKWEQIKEIKIEKEDFDINNYKEKIQIQDKNKNIFER